MNNQEQDKFLGKLYDMLLRNDIVTEKERAKDLKTKVLRVQKYFDKVERVQDKAISNDRYLNMIKELYYERYIIKREDIPESYLRSLEKQYLDNGHGHVNLVEPKNDIDRELREEHINNVIREQKESLDNWLNYLMSPDSSYLSMWAKIWAFQGMLGIGNLNDDKNGYKKRSNVTVNPFVAIDSEILGQCVQLLKDTLNKKEITDSELERIVKSGNFSKIYGILLANKKQIKTNGTEGIWIKYNYETVEEADKKEKEGIEPEYLRLYNSLQGYNTGWCTAGSRETAKEQICGSRSYLGGDFYVYYSKDENGEYKIPRIAIRMNRTKIGEIRGIAKSQNIESDMEVVLDEKLKDFPDAKEYQKKVSDMKKLTEIYYKHQSSIELTREDLIFLYEIYDDINGFGYQKDPRIEEIKNSRNKRKDLAYALDCTEEEIGFSSEDLKRVLVYYEGDITYSSLDLIPNLTLPKIVKGDVWLEGVKSPTGLELPQVVSKNLYLGSLTSAKGLRLPQSIGRDLNLESLTSADGLKLPKNIEGDLNLLRLVSAEGVEFPEKVGGNLKLGSLTSAKGLKLPKKIEGDLILGSLTSAEGLELPEYIGGDLELGGLTSSKGLKLPKSVGGYLGLGSLTTAEGLELPENVGGYLYLQMLISAKGLKFPKNVGKSVNLSSLTNAEGVKLPERVELGIWFKKLTSLNGLILPEYVGASIQYKGKLWSLEEIKELQIKELQIKEENEYSVGTTSERKSNFLKWVRETLLGLDKENNSNKNGKKGF